MEINICKLLLVAIILIEISSFTQPAQVGNNPEHKLRHAHAHRKKHAREHDKSAADHNDHLDTIAVENLHRSKHYRQHKFVKSNDYNYKNMPRLWQHLQENTSEDNEQQKRKQADFISLSKSKTEQENVGSELSEEALYTDEIYADSKEKLPASTHRNVKHKPRTRCPKCEANNNVAHVTEEELTQLRIEYVKQQILEKLRIKEPPKVEAVRLPIEPIDEQPTKSKDLDEYYARSSKKFIFLEKVHNCPKYNEAASSICFSFKIDDQDMDGFDVNTAVLWIFKNRGKFNRPNDTILEKETIVVTELQQTPDPRYLPISKTIAIQAFNLEDEWLKINIEWPTKRWFGNHELSHLIQISCQACGPNALEEMISVNKDYRPFIMIDTQNRTKTSRQKRGINCTQGVKECCREKLYISFKEIGWGDWIIQPQGYDAYFCRGSCNSVASVAQSSSHHHTFFQKLLRSGNTNKPLELIPCCTAKQYSSLQLVFMDSNNTATQRTFPNMVVESCGCR